MPSSGGVRRGAGRPVDPNSKRSMIKGLSGKEDWVTLPADGHASEIPEWPLELVKPEEFVLWGELWSRPQSLMWELNRMAFQVALYVRTYFEAAEPGSIAGIKSAAVRMEAELGLSFAGMKMLGWQISADLGEPEVETPARRTTSGAWLKSVSVANA